MRALLYISLCALLFLSCQPGTEEGNGRISPLEGYNAGNFIYDSAEVHRESSAPPDRYGEEDTIVEIKFKELELTINGLSVEDPDLLKATQADSVELFCALGFGIEGKVISLTSSNLDSLQVEQYYQTSLTIQGEGPHCDLLDWKHYTSEKKVMKEISPGQFLFANYTREEIRKFPDVTMKQVKQEVKNTCGDEWYQAAKNCKAVTEYPCAVGVSTYYITIKALLKGSGKRISKLIAIGFPMGC